MNMYDGDGSIPWVQWLYFFFFNFLSGYLVLSLFAFLLPGGGRTSNQNSIQGVPVDYGRWTLLRIRTALWMEI
ncbi:hypothetical protein BDV38DRAFT_250382 [Aspergillus pseudotamarii]|uniref:Uncharacterized protein n=1 Tax=Aspergillus pseudotamarii TaxID=132259 RepID=A0A5N6SS92_ASPPS|nr:uncharacterized protein BDV38DRAFT_250382 [Aspergillus pseudotamarii]KAE8136253.1 hypothetical protein BDV38DRAFT_250382 [Aspergillus pseudotamarii]